MSEKTVLYLDLVGGAAGDMILSALVDAGASLDAVRAAVAAVGLARVTLNSVEVHPAGLRALRIDVLIDGVLGDTGVVEGTPHVVVEHSHGHGKHHHHAPHRPYRVIRDQIAGAAFDEAAKTLALEAFHRLAEAESLAHGVPVDDVEFHEVGSDDAIADIVGASVALTSLGVDEVVVSPAPLGSGLTRGAHGPIPLPGPATLHLLRGAPTIETTLRGETVTPTGAALLATFADRWGAIPSMTIARIGVGAGHKSWPDRPNVIRAMLGQSTETNPATAEDLVAECNLDDMSPEHLAGLERALFAAGALDVWSTPVHMKKGRVGITVSALARRTERASIVEAFLEHSTTLGVRVYAVERHRAPRRVTTVSTAYGEVRVKIADRRHAPLVTPEHDDVEQLAEAAGVPLRVVYEAALAAAWALGETG